MAGLPQLAMGTPAELLYPPDAAFMARTDLETTRLLGYSAVNLEAVTSQMIGILGSRPSVRHVSVATEEIQTFLCHAGLPPERNLHLYETEEEAYSIGDALIKRGSRLISPYPLPSGRFPNAGVLVPEPLWRTLNAKKHLPDLVGQDAVPDRQIVSLAQLFRNRPIPPVFLKSGGGSATGWGYSVRFCANSTDIEDAVEWFAAEGITEDIIVEVPVAVERCWCANIAITTDAVSYIGSAEQVFARPGAQTGSVIDPEYPLPRRGVEIVLSAGRKAQSMGFRGVAAIDVGCTEDGHQFAFDPNFRINASTSQILFHDSAARRVGLPASTSFISSSKTRLTDVFSATQRAVDEGWFIPLRAVDAVLLPAAAGVSQLAGFVLGETPDRATANASKLHRMIPA